jgi:hypothetical protein
MDLLQDFVQCAVSRGALTELMYLWAPTPWQGEEGLLIRNLINNCIPALAEFYSMKVVKETTFPEFMKLYDEYVYTKAFYRSPNKTLAKFINEGNLRGVKTAISKGATYRNQGLRHAAKGGYWELVEYFIGMEAVFDWEAGLDGAAEGGHRELVEFFFKKGAVDAYGAMLRAVKGGHKDLVQMLLEQAISPRRDRTSIANSGLHTASGVGNLELAKFFVAEGANNLNPSLVLAVYRGYETVVDFLIKKGANDLKEALRMANVGGHANLVTFLQQKIQ